MKGDLSIYLEVFLRDWPLKKLGRQDWIQGKTDRKSSSNWDLAGLMSFRAEMTFQSGHSSWEQTGGWEEGKVTLGQEFPLDKNNSQGQMQLWASSIRCGWQVGHIFYLTWHNLMTGGLGFICIAPSHIPKA